MREGLPPAGVSSAAEKAVCAGTAGGASVAAEAFLREGKGEGVFSGRGRRSRRPGPFTVLSRSAEEGPGRGQQAARPLRR